MKVLYILNPAAGGVRRPGMADEIRYFAARVGLGGEVVVTTAPGHATEIARAAAASGCEIVVAVGGDGTANEVAAGLIGTEAALGVLPAGSGNDLAHELGLPRNWRDALAAFTRATRGRIDVGRANDRPFLQSAGAGADAFIAGLRQRERRFSGPALYAKCAVQGLLAFPPAEVTLDLDGRRWTQRALAVTVANGERYGGGLRIAPGARHDDGLLDVAVIGDMAKLEALRIFPTVYFGRHVGHPKFRLERGACLLVDTAPSGQPLPFHVDGTPQGTTPVRFTVQPRALSVLSFR